ncbi:hypothetical protein Daus18300_014564 [Diaporthe australafricana]|uniref:Apple domain-containing protein n=1 Tax=Diaporthe australafricana TaxID=127596 RepID=A0ABR3VUI9_9PEZI
MAAPGHMYSDLPEVHTKSDYPEVNFQQYAIPEVNTKQYGLPEVVPHSAGPLPEVSPGYTQGSLPEFHSGYSRDPLPEEGSPPFKTEGSPHNEQDGAGGKKRICGLAARSFWIIFAVALAIIVAAAVGGGVGGSIATRNKAVSTSSEEPISSTTGTTAASTTETAAASTSETATATTTTSASVTTTEVVGATSTLYRDCPSSNETLYSVDFGSTGSYIYRKFCSMSIVDNGVNLVNTPTTSLDACINLCAAYNMENATEIASGASQPCNSVCWRNGFTDNDWPGQCFGATTQNSSSTGWKLDNTETICDSAGWINQ